MRKKNLDVERRRFQIALDPEHPRDRQIGEWLNEQYNASETVKQLLIAVISGQRMGLTTVPLAMDEAIGPHVDRSDPRVQALLGMET